MRPIAIVPACAFSLLIAAAAALPARQAPPGAPAAAAPVPVVGVTAAEVSVDFVVRDKKGRIVRDLKPADIEVLEDGVRQEVGALPARVDRRRRARPSRRRAQPPREPSQAAGAPRPVGPARPRRRARGLRGPGLRPALAGRAPHRARRRARVAEAAGRRRPRRSASSASTRASTSCSPSPTTAAR